MTKRQLRQRHSLRRQQYAAQNVPNNANIAFGPKISRECMGWRPGGHVARGAWILFPGWRCPGQQWLFVHMWRVSDQSRSRILDNDITNHNFMIDRPASAVSSRHIHLTSTPILLFSSTEPQRRRLSSTQVISVIVCCW